METLNFSENLVQLRRERKITQEELAEFVGVTKASVSKWETKQSLPDVLLLPKLASFFGVPVDALLGYEPQLSKEQIQKIYRDLAVDFTKLPFEEVMQKSNLLVKQYYSCYPFLLQIAVLWFNHMDLVKERERQQEVLRQIGALCQHIIDDGNNIKVCNDAIMIKAMVDLQLGNVEQVMDALEEMFDPFRFNSQGELLLIQAYQSAGRQKEAVGFTQITMYNHVLALLACAIQYLSVNSSSPDVCKETICRMEQFIEMFHLNSLHPNSTAQFYYQAAIAYMIQGKEEKAATYLGYFVHATKHLLKDDCLKLHGDAYFDCLEEWFEKLDLGAYPPRESKLVYQSVIMALQNPIFEPLNQNQEYKKLQKDVQKMFEDKKEGK